MDLAIAEVEDGRGDGSQVLWSAALTRRLTISTWRLPLSSPVSPARPPCREAAGHGGYGHVEPRMSRLTCLVGASLGASLALIKRPHWRTIPRQARCLGRRTWWPADHLVDPDAKAVSPTVATARTGVRTKVKTTNTVSSCLRRDSEVPRSGKASSRGFRSCLGPKRAIASRQWHDVSRDTCAALPEAQNLENRNLCNAQVKSQV